MLLASNLKKPKENQCFWLRTLKNIRKMNVFALPKHLVRGSRETPERLQRGSKTPERHQRDTRESAERQQDTREILCEVDLRSSKLGKVFGAFFGRNFGVGI